MQVIQTATKQIKNKQNIRLEIELHQEVITAIPGIRVNPKSIPEMEMKLLCATFLEATIRFCEERKNIDFSKNVCAGKGGNAYGSKDG